MIQKLRNAYYKYVLLRHEYALYEKYSGFTMIPTLFYVNNLLVASKAKSVTGAIVECGVWKGGMSAGLASLLGPDRAYFLFDSFEGLPDATENDGEKGLNWKKNPDNPWFFDNCKTSEDFAQKAMQLSGAKNFRLMKGWFNETLPKFDKTQKIALLRLDGDWYESTLVCLNELFDCVVPGGIIIIDDYYSFEGCSKAVHEFLATGKRAETIRQESGICFIVKC